MKAIGIKVKGHDSGGLALCFPNAESMGLFAVQMLKLARKGNCNICANVVGTSPEQGQLNVDMAAFEARCMPDYDVSRIEVPVATAGHVSVEVPSRSGLSVIRMNGAGGRKGRPNAELLAQPGEMRASCDVMQPWEKQGISRGEWEENRGA